MKKAAGIFVYIFGMAVMSASVTMIIALSLAMDKKPQGRTPYEQYWDKFENHYYLVGEDFQFAVILGCCVAAAWIIINLVLLFTGGFDAAYYQSVQETLKIPFVRFFGVLILSGAIGGALCFILEYTLATPKYPPHYEEWYQFAVVFALFGIIIYYLVRFVGYLFRKKRKPGVIT